MSLNACRSIHQGHEWVILVMTLKEDKRFLCVWLLYDVGNFCRFANIDQVLLHGRSFFLLSAFSSSFFVVLGKNTSIRSKPPTAVCERKERKV